MGIGQVWYKGRYGGFLGFLGPGKVVLIPLFPETTVLSDYSRRT